MMLTILASTLSAIQTPPVWRPDPLPPVQNAWYCLNSKTHHADSIAGAKARSLGDLPEGNSYLAVEFRVKGCQIPVMTKYGIGRGGR
jgi:hypothetical protein